MAFKSVNKNSWNHRGRCDEWVGERVRIPAITNSSGLYTRLIPGLDKSGLWTVNEYVTGRGIYFSRSWGDDRDGSWFTGNITPEEMVWRDEVDG